MDYKVTIQKYEICYHISESYRPNNSPAEAAIQEVEKRTYCIMAKKNIPLRLWDFALTYTCETGSFTDSGSQYACD